MKKGAIPVFISADEGYAPYLATLIASACVNTKSHLNFYTIGDPILENTREKIRSMKREFKNFDIEFMDIDMDKYFKDFRDAKTYSVAPQWTRTTYSRMLVPELKHDIDKAIQLDADIIVLGDLQKMYDEPLDGYGLGAVIDQYIMTSFIKKSRMGFSKEHIYFNAGVLLIDCKKWRNDKCIDELFRIEQEYRSRIDFVEQDILNKYFENNYKKLPTEYNATNGLMIKAKFGWQMNYEFALPKKSNIIVRHFEGPQKPWNSTIKSNLTIINIGDFWYYAALTPFYNEIQAYFEKSERATKSKESTDKLSSNQTSRFSLFQAVDYSSNTSNRFAINLFGFIPLLSIKANVANDSSILKLKLFYFLHIASIIIRKPYEHPDSILKFLGIPLFTIKRRTSANKTVYKSSIKLFSFFTLLYRKETIDSVRWDLFGIFPIMRITRKANMHDSYEIGLINIIKTDERVFVLTKNETETPAILILDKEKIRATETTMLSPRLLGIVDFHKMRGGRVEIYELSSRDIRSGVGIAFESCEGARLRIGYSNINLNLPPHNSPESKLPKYRLCDGTILFEAKRVMFWRTLLSPQYSIKDKIRLLQILLAKKDKSIFFEHGDCKSDSGFALFKSAVKRGMDAHFVTSSAAIATLKDKELRDRCLLRGSRKHERILMRAAFICGSDKFQFGLCHSLRDIHYNMINSHFYMPHHGITLGDRDHTEVSTYNYGNADILFCANELEKKEFINLEYRKVLITGYPRFDKWLINEEEVDNDMIAMFFTWRPILWTISEFQFANSAFCMKIIALIRGIVAAKPNMRIVFIPHSAIPVNKAQILFDALISASENIRCLLPTDEKWIESVRKARYFITDYSSLAIDFAYKRGCFPIYFLPRSADGSLDNEFFMNHYELTNLFYQYQPGMIAENLSDVLRALDATETEDMRRRKSALFPYRDDNNCSRVLDEILKDITR